MITAITGRNASGKTQWVEQFRRQTASDALRYIAFRDSYGPSVDSAYYLQLRWNQHDIDAETPTVREKLGTLTEADEALIRLFRLEQTLDKYIITLSSGELRKFQLVKALMSKPKILILDNPFIGLDAETRQQLRDLLKLIADEQHIDLYLVFAKTDDIPEYVDQTISLECRKESVECRVESVECRVESVEFATAHEQGQTSANPTAVANSQLYTLNSKLSKAATTPLSLRRGVGGEAVIQMRNVTIRYGERTILKDLNWTVRSGERWALTGQNGSGKSTLLSLVCADNPQAYACDISLFGHRRGEGGVSIWDIKRHIGYVSPELARSYHRDIPALRIVASGLKDTVGLYVRPNDEEKEQCRQWMRVFGIEHLADRSFLQMSSGEQRLVLLARAFVKDPELLILDEPLHGLDNENRQLVRNVIEAFCQRPDKTLIMVTHYEEELPSCITHRLHLLSGQAQST